ncbi:hypothetical protein HMPREF1580_01229 [Gardnerella vaginalis JCP8070]|nr:hypothetical protein HMPREF1580_01229 [Gardnerella vaginalis JCP8070]
MWILVQSAENNSGFCTIFRSNLVQSAEVFSTRFLVHRPRERHDLLFRIVTAVVDT